ncbi:ABC transporter permease [Stella sp.]|uniref:ABC transporter permease n=1 Tax=Stella sp. TaxID=2912054 RepID=UPI0035B2C548
MLAFVAKRLLLAVPTMLLAASAVFFLARILPGDPALAILGESASEQAIVAMRARLGLDQPLLVQYGIFLGDLLRFDLGRSMLSGHAVTAEVAEVLPYTIELTVFAIAFGLLLGVPIGIAASLARNRLPDYLSRFGSLVGLSCPPFFLGICLLLVFAIHLPLFPVISAPDAGGGGRVQALILPGVTLGIIFLAFVARSSRAAMLEVLPEAYVRTARMKGLSERAVIFRHACRNALLPIVTVAGLYFGILMGNAVVTEIVFTRPGLGKLIIGALNSRDYVMLQGLTIVYCFIVVLVNLATDLVYGLVDPRVKVR